MKRFFRIYILLLTVALTGCNDDIFLDGPDIPEIQSVTIDGDGGETAFTIPTKGLESVTLNLTSTGEKYCHYYNAAGEEIDSQSPASEVHRIVFENRFSKLECTRSGSELTVRSICSASQTDAEWDIRLEYSHGVRYISVTVLPGRPVQFLGVVYDDDITISDRAHVTSQIKSFNNNGPIPQKLIVYPFLNELPSVLVESDQFESWLYQEQFNLPVPVYVDGDWKFETKEGIRVGTKHTYTDSDRFVEVDVDVPANSHVMVFVDVVYAGAFAKGRLMFHNEVLDVTFSENISVKSLYPTGYEMRIEDAQ